MLFVFLFMTWLCRLFGNVRLEQFFWKSLTHGLRVWLMVNPLDSRVKWIWLEDSWFMICLRCIFTNLIRLQAGLACELELKLTIFWVLFTRWQANNASLSTSFLSLLFHITLTSFLSFFLSVVWIVFVLTNISSHISIAPRSAWEKFWYEWSFIGIKGWISFFSF